MRALVGLLLLVIVFFSGVLFGSHADLFKKTGTQHETHDAVDVLYAAEHTNVDTPPLTAPTSFEVDDTEPTQTVESMHLTQQIAHFFEVVITGFYEIIVTILYQISMLFF